MLLFGFGSEGSMSPKEGAKELPVVWIPSALLMSSPTAVRGGGLRWPEAPEQCGALRSLLQHLGCYCASAGGRELCGGGALCGPALCDRGRKAGRWQHQQGRRGSGGMEGALEAAEKQRRSLYARYRLEPLPGFAFFVVNLFSSPASRGHLLVSGKGLSSEKQLQVHTVGQQPFWTPVFGLVPSIRVSQI